MEILPLLLEMLLKLPQTPHWEEQCRQHRSKCSLHLQFIQRKHWVSIWDNMRVSLELTGSCLVILVKPNIQGGYVVGLCTIQSKMKLNWYSSFGSSRQLQSFWPETDASITSQQPHPVNSWRSHWWYMRQAALGSVFSELPLSVLSGAPVSEVETCNRLMWKTVRKLVSQLWLTRSFPQSCNKGDLCKRALII